MTSQTTFTACMKIIHFGKERLASAWWAFDDLSREYLWKRLTAFAQAHIVASSIGLGLLVSMG